MCYVRSVPVAVDSWICSFGFHLIRLGASLGFCAIIVVDFLSICNSQHVAVPLMRLSRCSFVFMNAGCYSVCSLAQNNDIGGGVMSRIIL